MSDWVNLLQQFYPMLRKAGVITVPKNRRGGYGVLDIDKLDKMGKEAARAQMQQELAVGANDANYLIDQRRQGNTAPTYPVDTYPGSKHPKET